MTRIVPTVGRKLYFTSVNDTSISKLDEQPIDATIIYVHPKKEGDDSPWLLNLHIIDHAGSMQTKTRVPLIQAPYDVEPTDGYFAYWMPYQVGQAKTNAVPTVESTGESSAASATQPVVIENLPNPSVQNVDIIKPSAPATTGNGSATSNDFSGALSQLRAGKAVTRKAWGPNVFIYLVPAASYKAQTGIAKKVFGEDALVPYMAYLAIKRADGQVCVFNPGVDSILAEDWEISQ